jgi:hypothetical protein
MLLKMDPYQGELVNNYCITTEHLAQLRRSDTSLLSIFSISYLNVGSELTA